MMMADTGTGIGAGSSPFEPDAPGLTPDPGAGQPVEEPDIRKTGEALRDRFEIRSLAITGLFVLALFYTLYFARAFFLPIVLAVLLDWPRSRSSAITSRRWRRLESF